MKLLLLLSLLSAPPTITIDDGPHYRHHTKTLQLLRQHNVKAIWFVNGHFLRSSKGRKLLRQIIAAGHRVENHTYSHRPPCKLTARQFRIELIRNERAVNRTLGWPKTHRMKLYRPPFGQRCHVKTARQMGYRVMYWHRADIGSSAAAMVNTVKRRLAHRPPRDSILLFHYHNHKLQVVLRAFYPVSPKKSPPRISTTVKP